MNAIIEQINWEKVGGLVPVIIQNQNSLQILMLGYMNREALQKTINSKQVTFYSRSKQKLWTKGETSGHYLKVEAIEVDCDGDTLLIKTTPNGDTCHLGQVSCFSQNEENGYGFLSKLEQIIEDRSKEVNAKSYTSKLLTEGCKRIAQKVGEEGVEVALAAVSGNLDELHDEAADLIFHLMVLLKSCNTNFTAIVEKLRLRDGFSSLKS